MVTYLYNSEMSSILSLRSLNGAYVEHLTVVDITAGSVSKIVRFTSGPRLLYLTHILANVFVLCSHKIYGCTNQAVAFHGRSEHWIRCVFKSITRIWPGNIIIQYNVN